MSITKEKAFIMAREGNVEAFEALIEKYEKKVYKILLRVTGDGRKAFHVSQEVFVTVFRKMKHLEEEKLLSLMIYNTVRDYLSGNTKESSVEWKYALSLEDRYGRGSRYNPGC